MKTTSFHTESHISGFERERQSLTGPNFVCVSFN